MKDKRVRDDLSSREGERKGKRCQEGEETRALSVVLQKEQHSFCVILSMM